MTRDRSYHPSWILVGLGGTLVVLWGSWAFATEPPHLVSPGGEKELLAVASSCPTFSWGRAESTQSYQLAILPVLGGDVADAEIGDPLIIETLPGGATSWTPPGNSCLESGGSYAWTVRALAADPAKWAEPRFFTVPALPGADEVRRAAEVLRSAGLLERPLAATSSDTDAGGKSSASPPSSASRASNGRGPQRAGTWVRTAAAVTTPDRTGMKAVLPDSAEIGYGIQGLAATTGAGSAGVVGEATAVSGAVHGVVGVTHSAGGSGGLFENTAGGPILSGLGLGGEVFTVDPAGAVSASLFIGSGSGLVDLQWASLDNVPGGFDDGVDNDTVYQAGAGLRLSGDTLRVASLPMEMYVKEQLVAIAGAAEDPSIIIGRDGLPLISYYDAGSGDLEVVHCEDTICSEVSANTLDSAGIVGQHNSITIGRDGNALISYYDDSLNRLKLAHCRDVACSSADLTVVDSAGDVGKHSSITTNDQGYAFIAYYHAAGKLMAASCSNLTCTSRMLRELDSGGVGEYTSVTRNFSGWIFISYYDAVNGSLKLARCGDNFPNCSALYLIDADAGPHNDITTGSDGHPMIAYENAARSVIRVAHCERHFTCESPTIRGLVLGTGQQYQGISITRGADGLAMITSTSGSNTRGVTTYRCADVACSNSTLENGTGDNGAVHAAVTIGSDRLPIIAYTSEDDGDLYVAHCSNVACQPYLREP